VDLGDPVAVESLWAGLDEPPKWLANLTGGYAGGSVEDADPDSVRAQIDLNLLTVWWSCRSAIPRMKGGGGAIVNVAARAGLVGGAGNAAYAVTKAGVAKFTEVLAEEMQGESLRVNAIAPAIIATASNAAAFGPKTMAKAVAPEELAEVIGFLCSEASEPVTGSIVPAYGTYELPS
jgi:NAD(P)-dependent dehydrogenase (short-subunit alcohol dehydrogenase family)